MAALRRHWRTTVALAVLILGAGAWIWQEAHARMAISALVLQEETQPPIPHPPMQLVQRDAVVTLLNDLKLDRDALIALQLSAQTAETLLSTTRTWQANNAGTITTLNNTIHAKRYAVRQIEKAQAMGPYDAERAAALASARSDLQEALAAYKTALGGLEMSIAAGLSQGQMATWTAIKSGWGQQMPIRMLDLTDAQRLAVSDAHQRYQRQFASASSAEERATALSTWQSALDSNLTAEQKTAVASYNSSYAASSAVVADAINTVLPLEESVAQANRG